jgi:hypothetical protein
LLTRICSVLSGRPVYKEVMVSPLIVSVNGVPYLLAYPYCGSVEAGISKALPPYFYFISNNNITF